MTVLLEFKEKLRSFYGKYDTYLTPVAKGLLALAVFMLIRTKLGYMARLNSLPLLLILALACSILPMAATLVAAGILVVLHCYALSLPAAVTVFVLFTVMYLLYFRFSPRTAYYALLTPIAFLLGVPYAMPVANGLLGQPTALIPTVCGTVAYYFLKGISENATSLAQFGGEEQMLDKFAEIINQLTGNRELYLTVAAFMLVTLVVYLLRRLSVDYAWTIAIITGILLQYLLFFVGYLTFGMKNKTVMLTVGCVLSTLILFVLQFFLFNLDYTRTERVQFEDDEYYYYVKAVPKRYLSGREKTVKKISGNSRSRKENKETVTRRELMEDMDIDVRDENR